MIRFIRRAVRNVGRAIAAVRREFEPPKPPKYPPPWFGFDEADQRLKECDSKALLVTSREFDQLEALSLDVTPIVYPPDVLAKPVVTYRGVPIRVISDLFTRHLLPRADSEVPTHLRGACWSGDDRVFVLRPAADDPSIEPGVRFFAELQVRVVDRVLLRLRVDNDHIDVVFVTER